MPHDEDWRKRLDQLAWILDSSIPVPLLNFRIGVESLLGLIPGLGDALGAILSSYFIIAGYRLRVSKSTLIRMGANIAVEALVGAIPLVGDIFDFAWKANQRNVRLLQAHIHEPEKTRRGSLLFVVLAGFAVLLIIGAGVYLAALFLRWLWGVATP